MPRLLPGGLPSGTQSSVRTEGKQVGMTLKVESGKACREEFLGRLLRHPPAFSFVCLAVILLFQATSSSPLPRERGALTIAESQRTVNGQSVKSETWSTGELFRFRDLPGVKNLCELYCCKVQGPLDGRHESLHRRCNLWGNHTFQHRNADFQPRQRDKND